MTTQSKESPTSRRSSPTSSVQTPLETYLREINETALLNANEEKELAYRIAEGDNQARLVCPDCGETRTKFVGGDELDIAYLEAEESCPV